MLEAESVQNARTERTANARIWLSLVLFVLVPARLAGQPPWKTFVSRAGWSMNYPADWTLGSCQSCKDPTAADVYVDFFPSKRADGFVMVEPLAKQPTTMTLDKWLNNIKSTNDQNPGIAERRFTLNSLPALRVRYRTAGDGGYESETVYVVSRGRTFAIEFSAERGGVSLEAVQNYSTYLEMVKTFKMKP